METSPGSEEQSIIFLDDDLWERLNLRTNGAAAACYQCGSCTATCPWGLVESGMGSARVIMREAQLGLTSRDGGLWLCTDCGQCEAICPKGVPVADISRTLREIAWEERHQPDGLSPVLWSIYWNNNPWSQPPSERFSWSQSLELPIYNQDEHELLLYIGCTSSYDPRLAKSARSLARLLIAAGLSFGVLGEEEPCCGDAAFSLGHRPFFNEIAEKTASLIIDRNVSRLVTVSPHCYNVFKNQYPKSFQKKVEVLHYTQFINQLVNDGSIVFWKPLSKAVTYHDPCLLSRIEACTEGSRQILNSIPGLTLVEMERRKGSTLCCGGGGGRMWQETDSSQRFADQRLKEASRSGAEILVTACPFCLTCFEDSIKFNSEISLTIMDLSELCDLSVEQHD